MVEFPIFADHAATTYAASWLLTFAIHSTVALGGGWALTRVTRSLNLRDAIWKAALVVPLITATMQVGLRITPVTGSIALSNQAPPEASLALPGGESEELPTLAISETMALVESEAVAVEHVASAASGDFSAVDLAAARESAVTRSTGLGLQELIAATGLPGALLLVWGIGVAIGLGRLGYARWQLTQALNSRRPIHDPVLLNELARLRATAKVRRPIRLTWSPDLSVPVAFGWEVCLPRPALSRMGPPHLLAVLAHETAHVARRDSLWLMTTLVFERLFFFQPLYLVARREMQSVAEYLCDDWAIVQTGRTLTIAESLAEVAEWLTGARSPVTLPSMAHDESQLVRRVERILDESARPVEDLTHRRRALPVTGVLTATAVLSFTIPGVVPQATGAGQAEAQMAPSRPEVVDPNVDRVTAAAAALAAATQQEPTATRMADTDGSGTIGNPDVAEATVADRIDPEPAAPANTVEVPVALGTRVVESVRSASDAPIVTVLAGQTVDETLESRQDTVDQRVVASLVRALSDSTPAVRKEAAQALGQLKARTAAPALIESLRDTDAEVRATAVWALARMEDQSAANGLVAALDDPSPKVRKMAAEAVGKLGVRVATPELTALLRDDVPEIRRVAVAELWRLRDTTAVTAIARLVADSSAAVRRTAVSALGRFRQPSSFSTIAAALSDEDAGVRREAVRALARLDDPRATAAYASLLDDPSPEVRKTAVSALGESEDTTTVPALIGALDDQDAEVRVAAVQALREYDDPRSLAPLMGMLTDPSPEVRASVLRGLAELRNDEVIPALVDAAASDSIPAIRRAALSGLARFYRPAVAAALTAGLSDSDHKVRYTAARGLGQLAEFQRGRRARDHAYYTQMVEAMPRAIPALLVALRDDDSDVREASARTLGYLGNAEALDGLAAALQDGASDVRKEAIYALGRIGDDRAVEPLIAATQDPDSEVRRAAVRTLGQLQGR